MNKAALRISALTIDPNDSIWHLELSATDGRFSAAQEFWLDVEWLREFSERLLPFPETPSSDVIWETGSLEGRATEYVRLRVYLADAAGHGMIEVWIDNRRSGAQQARSVFNIPCEVAAINRLGERLNQWLSKPQQPMIWQTQQERF